MTDIVKSNPVYSMGVNGGGGGLAAPIPQQPSVGKVAVAFAMSSPLVMMAASPPLTLLKIRHQVAAPWLKDRLPAPETVAEHYAGCFSGICAAMVTEVTALLIKMWATNNNLYLGNRLLLFSKTITTLAAYPLDMKRTLEAVGHKKVFWEQDYKAMYTGLKVTLAGAVVYHVTIATVTGATSSVASPLVADTLGVITAGLASYPLDTVGKRLVVQMGSKTPRYSGARDCIKKVVAEEWVAALWGGVGYSVLSATLGLLATLPMILMNEQSQ